MSAARRRVAGGRRRALALGRSRRRRHRPAGVGALTSVVEHDRLVGLLPFDAVSSVPRDEWHARKVRDVMLPRDQVTVLDADREAGDAVHELAGAGVERALVVEDDHLVGLVAPADLRRAARLADTDQPAG